MSGKTAIESLPHKDRIDFLLRHSPTALLLRDLCLRYIIENRQRCCRRSRSDVTIAFVRGIIRFRNVLHLGLLLLMLLVGNSSANDLMPIAGVYYDNINAANVTLGVAHLDSHDEHFDSGYYADVTHSPHVRIITAGYASVGEWGMDLMGFAAMQIIDDGHHQNYVGLSFTVSLLI